MLRVEEINVFYGEIQVLWNLSFNVEDKKITAILGSNGAGKTTTLKTIAGLLHPKTGVISFNGNNIHRFLPHKIAELGIQLVPEGRGLFPYMTVEKNLLMGAYNKKAWERREEAIKLIYDLFPVLKERKKQKASTLSGGEQQMLAIGRALMANPTLLMLDEPSLGLAPKLVLKVFDIVKRINSEGITILLVEQNIKHTLEICDMAYIIETGKIILRGSGEELFNNRYVKKAYLGM